MYKEHIWNEIVIFFTWLILILRMADSTPFQKIIVFINLYIPALLGT